LPQLQQIQLETFIKMKKIIFGILIGIGFIALTVNASFPKFRVEQLPDFIAGTNISIATTSTSTTITATTEVPDTTNWVVSGTDMYATGTVTKVGIATSSPAYTLDIEGDLGVNATATFSGNIEMQDGKYLYFDTAKTKPIYYSASHDDIIWGDNYFAAIDELNIAANTGADASGNWEPYINLGIGGNIDMGNTTQGVSRYLRINFTDGVKMRTSGISQYAIIKADNLSANDKTFQFPNQAGEFLVSTGSQMVIDYLTGNVGIGATNPGDLLNVSGSDKNIRITNTNTGDSGLQLYYDTTQRAAFTYNEGTADINIKNYYTGGADYGSIRFFVNNAGTEALTIKQSGYVGIATTSPAYTLDVNGTLGVSGASTLGNVTMVGDFIASSSGSFVPPTSRDASPVTGTLRVDTANGFIEFYDGSEWQSADCPKYIQMSTTSIGDGDFHMLDDTNWGTSKAEIKVIRVVATSTDWDMWLMQNDDGYASNTAAMPRFQIMEAGNGDADIFLGYPYEDEDDSNEVHLYYVDNNATDTIDVYLIGSEMR